MEKIPQSNNQEKTVSKFNSPQEELDFLKSQIERKEKEIQENQLEKKDKEENISEVLSQYSQEKSEEVLTQEHQISQPETDAIILDLEPKDSDKKMESYLGLLEEKGIKNTLTIIQKAKDFAVEDDFHRILVQYIKKGYKIKDLKENTPLFQTLKTTLYEVSLLKQQENTEKTLKELVSSMEQFYAGMLSSVNLDKKETSYFSLEIALPSNNDEIIFYVAVSDNKKDLFEKQILSIFPNIKIREEKNDYSIFTKDYILAGSQMSLYQKAVHPIKTYEDFDYDPLNIVMNSLSKLSKEEGGSIQIIFNTKTQDYNEKYKTALEKIQRGVPKSEALNIPETSLGQFSKVIFDTFKSQKKPSESTPIVDEILVENIKNKIASPIIQTNIRLISSAETQDRADNILSEIESSFNQFENPTGNKIIFKKLKKGALEKLAHNFSFRNFNKNGIIPLNLKEITTLFHFPNTNTETVHQLKQTKAKSAPAPLVLPKEGILLGTNTHHNSQTDIYMSPEDRLRHFYVIGQTGTGKTVLLKNMIVQDIKNGEGVCMIDPHGSDIQEVLANIPPERYEDVIYIDPADTSYSVGLNMLEYNTDFPEQKTFVVNEMLSIFDKLFDMKTAGGPMFEQYFRNAVLLVIDDPKDNPTLLDIPRILTNKEFRDEKLAKCTNPIVTQFWREIAEKSGGDASLENIVPYITSKFDVFLSNDLMRPIVAQSESTIDFRKIMDEKKILLVNLSKGRLGDINSHLLGLIIVGKITMAALSRASSSEFPPFYLYIDEFQNVTTDSISVILSEARKYKLSLNMAHQFIAQLNEGIRDAVFGNVGSMAVFRVGNDDAEYLSKQFEPTFDMKDIANLDNWNAYLKILANGQPQDPFNIQTVAPEKGDPNIIEKLKELSRLKYGKKKEIIDAEILEKYKN